MTRRKGRIKKPPAEKVWFRINSKDGKRLSEIAEKYGFKSRYELGQYIVACFLRVADPENDEDDTPVHDEIKEMFYDLSEAEKHFEFVKPKRRLPQHEIDELQGQLRLWQ